MEIPRGSVFVEDAPRVDLTPLVDVIFLLIIFFVLAIPSIMLPMGIKVKLPITSAATTLQASRIEVTVTAGDHVYLGGEEVTLSELEERAAGLAGQEDAAAHIRGDVSASLGRVVAVYGALKKAGIERISVATGIKVEEK